MSVLELVSGSYNRRVSFVAALTTMVAVARQRRALAKLDARMLEDIGITKTEALAEAGQPAWDVPAKWRR